LTLLNLLNFVDYWTDRLEEGGNGCHVIYSVRKVVR